MTKKIYSGLIAVLFVSILVGSCANQPKYEFEGTWKGNPTTGHYAGSEQTYKFTGDKFSVTTAGLTGKAAMFNGTLEGTWKITGKDTDESGTLKLHFNNPPGAMPADVDQKYKFKDNTTVTIAATEFKKQ